MENIVGTIKKVAGLNWRVLDKTDNGYLCIAEDSIGSMEFDEKCNDWRKSSLRKHLNLVFCKKLEDAGVKLVEFERDLLSLDGQTEYGTCKDFVSLLTVHEYQKYRKYIPNKHEWWWLCTPWSTPCNAYDWPVSVVSPSGFINCYDYCNGIGVRPVCIFSSSIFESE